MIPWAFWLTVLGDMTSLFPTEDTASDFKTELSVILVPVDSTTISATLLQCHVLQCHTVIKHTRCLLYGLLRMLAIG